MLMRTDRNVMMNFNGGERMRNIAFFQSVTQATKKKDFEYSRKVSSL